MAYEFTCSCGQVLQLSADATSPVTCSCGRTYLPPFPKHLNTDAGPALGENATAAQVAAVEQTDPEVERVHEFFRTLTELTPRVFVTPILIALNVLVFVLMIASGVHIMEPKVPDLLRWGADFGPLTLAGEWWRLLTCAFVHIGIIHLVFNMFVLATAGPLVERMLGNVGFLLMYIISALVGSIASLLWNPVLVSAGASGAIFGVYGCLLGLLLRNHASVPPQALAQLRNSGLFFVGYNLLYSMTAANVDMAAHVGGLLGGFLCGLVLQQPFSHASPAGRPMRNLGLAILGVVVTFAGAIAVQTRHGDQVEFVALAWPKVEEGNIEVLYGNDVPQADAQRLAKYLHKEWGGKNRASVFIKKLAEGYQFGMVIDPKARNDDRALSALAFVGARISRDVLGGAPVEVSACDERLRTLKVIPHRPDIRHSIAEGNIEVYYAADVDQKDAQRLATYLAKVYKDAAAARSFKLARHGNTMELHMIFAPAEMQNQEILASIRQFRTELAANVFPDRPVEVHLCDDIFQSKQVLP